MFEEEKNDYDPLISGLEPEPFDTVFQELFSGIKTYFAQEDPISVDVPELPATLPARVNPKAPPVSPNENFFPHPPGYKTTVKMIPTTASNAANILISTQSDASNMGMGSRQFPMIQCGNCCEQFVSEFALEFHEVKIHPELFSWYCEECDFEFETLKQASEHSMLAHGSGQMPVFSSDQFSPREIATPYYVQMVSLRSSDFVRKFRQSRPTRASIKAAYFAYAKCEVQAILTGSVGLVKYHQARTKLKSRQLEAEHEDLVTCLKSHFIYGQIIKRVPRTTYIDSYTVYKKLFFGYSPPKKPKQAVHSTLPNVVSSSTAIDRKPGSVMPRQYRMSPYTLENYRVTYQQTVVPIRRCTPRVMGVPRSQMPRRTDISAVMSAFPVNDCSI
uniref:C2H2-type domain-containing protein n=1 Tax=Caenorhabditis japonica TaxID=281687 RepID=A0A8R1DG13_CAEJA